MKNFKFLLMFFVFIGVMVIWMGCDDDGDNELEFICIDGI